jgi:SAM-dependent methyltransferase
VSIPWTEFLDGLRGRHPSLLAFAFDWWHYNVPLLERIRQIVSAPARIIEVGTGTGALAVFLAAHGYDVLGIDNDSQVIEKARGFAEHFHVPCRFEVADAFNLAAYRGSFDLAFSSGVIEHFPAEDASRMLREQGTAARYVLVAVPTWFALKNDPLTEASGARPIRLRGLKRICRRAGLEVLKGFGYGTPDGSFSVVYRHLLPHVVQWVLQNRLSYACTVGCIARSRTRGAWPREEG